MKRLFRNVLLMVIVWTFAFFLYDITRYSGLEMEYAGKVDGELERHLARSMMGGIVYGIMLGLVHTWLNTRALRRKPLGLILLIEISAFMLTFLLTLVVINIPWRSISSFSEAGIQAQMRQHFQQTPLWAILSYSFAVNICLSFFIQLYNKFGADMIYWLIIGRYHKPREEERIFMFLDMDDSTQIAEQLGHVKYSQLVQDWIYDLTEAVRQHQAKIYQYVGDEVVLIWAVEKGLMDANCVELFFSFQEILQKQSPHYLRKYQIVPQFKAGLNMGQVTMVEVGEIKREIAYHGDVINTAARVLGVASKTEKQLVVTSSIADPLSAYAHIHTKSIGKFKLKGKQKELELFEVMR